MNETFRKINISTSMAFFRILFQVSRKAFRYKAIRLKRTIYRGRRIKIAYRVDRAGQMRRKLHRTLHGGIRARQLGAPQGFRPKGATKAAAPPTARRPALAPAAYGGPLWRSSSRRLAALVSRDSRPGRQARRTEGAPLKP